MHRVDTTTAAAALPQPRPAGTPGYFTGGNPQTGQPATVVPYEWANAVQEEIANVILRGGVALDKTNNGQLALALSNLFTGALINITVTQGILVPAWAHSIAFRMVGAGGGGGHCKASAGTYLAGGGGGSGAYLEAQRAVTPGGTINAVIGAGGASEVGGGLTSLADPGKWSCTCGGGFPAGWDSPNNCHGGAGGAAAGGDLMSLGTFGGDGQASGVYASTGYGGPGPWGGGPRAGVPGPPGNSGAPGLGPGAGGGGVYDPSNTNIFYPAGAGAAGLLQYRFLP
jgi:hypothetical protein